MEKITLTLDEIRVIEEQLAGKITLDSATPYQKKWLSQVIDKALALSQKYPDDPDFDDDLIEWYYNKYKNQ